MRSQLADLIETCNWWQLSPHLARLVVVSFSLSLIDVGLALAEDNSPVVQQWIADGCIYHPTAEQISYWQDHPEIAFTSLIIYPFVLLQELKSV